MSVSTEWRWSQGFVNGLGSVLDDVKVPEEDPGEVPVTNDAALMRRAADFLTELDVDEIADLIDELRKAADDIDKVAEAADGSLLMTVRRQAIEDAITLTAAHSDRKLDPEAESVKEATTRRGVLGDLRCDLHDLQAGNAAE